MIIMAGMLLVVQGCWAYDFYNVSDGDTFYYNITNPTAPLLVEVTNNGRNHSSYSGNVTIPSSAYWRGATFSVNRIGNYAFYACNNINRITIPNSVTSIGDCAFASCDLTYLFIPNTIVSIGVAAFADCDIMTNVTIGNSVTRIGDGAFAGCSRLTSVTIPPNVFSIGEFVFSGCSNLNSINVSVGNYHYYSIDGVLFNNSLDSLICYPCGKTGCYTIPNSVVKIGKFAFDSCWGLTSLTISNNVTTIGECALYDCKNLTSIIIGTSVSNIEFGAFTHCISLDTIIFKSFFPPRIDNECFEGIPVSAIAIVPCGYSNTYRSHIGEWFSNIIEDCDNSLHDMDKTPFRLLPNPAKGYVSIDGVTESVCCIIMNSMGEIVKRFDNIKSTTKICITELCKGIYFANVNGTVLKLIVK